MNTAQTGINLCVYEETASQKTRGTTCFIPDSDKKEHEQEAINQQTPYRSGP
jgi:hypothetical protein